MASSRTQRASLNDASVPSNCPKEARMATTGYHIVCLGHFSCVTPSATGEDGSFFVKAYPDTMPKPGKEGLGGLEVKGNTRNYR